MKKIWFLYITLVLFSACSFNNINNNDGNIAIPCEQIMEKIVNSRGVVDSNSSYTIKVELSGDYTEIKNQKISGYDIIHKISPSITFEELPVGAHVYVYITISDGKNEVLYKGGSKAVKISAGENPIEVSLFGYYVDNENITLEATDSGILITPKNILDNGMFQIEIKNINENNDLFTARVNFDKLTNGSFEYKYVKKDGLYSVNYNLFDKDFAYLGQIKGGIIYAKGGSGERYVTLNSTPTVDWENKYIDLFYTVHGVVDGDFIPNQKQASVKFTQNDVSNEERYSELIDIKGEEENPNNHIRIEFRIFRNFINEIGLDTSKNYYFDTTAQLFLFNEDIQYSTYLMAEWLTNNGRYYYVATVQPGGEEPAVITGEKFQLTRSQVAEGYYAYLEITDESTTFDELCSIIQSNEVNPTITKTDAIAMLDFSCTSITELSAITAPSGESYSIFTPFNTVTIPTSVNKIDTKAFLNCKKLFDLVIEDDKVSGVTEIGESAFKGCTSLLTFEFPKTSVLGQNSFKNCTKLSTGLLKKECTIQSNSFEECSVLNTVIFVNDIDGDYYDEEDNVYVAKKWDSNFIEYPSLMVYNINDENFADLFDGNTLSIMKNNVTNIFGSDDVCLNFSDESNTFTTIPSKNNNSSYFGSTFKALVIPITVNTISVNAFYNCDGLSDVTFMDTYAWTYGENSFTPSLSYNNATTLKNNSSYEWIKNE